MTAPAGKASITTTFQFLGTAMVIYPYNAAPLYFGLLHSRPEATNLAVQANGAPPSMFSSGSLPAFTASGLDPSVLLELPWQVRHAAAMESDRGQVLAWLEAMGNDPDAVVPTPQLASYKMGTERWFSSVKPPTPEQWASFGAERQAAYTAAHDAWMESVVTPFEARRQQQATQAGKGYPGLRPGGLA